MKTAKFKMIGNASGIEKSSESLCLCASVFKKDAGAVECGFNTETQRLRGTEFKMTEICLIPEDWEVERIGDIGQVVTGSTPPRNNSANWGGDFNWISAKDFNGKYISKTEEHITEAGKRFCRLLPENSVLVTCIASIGLNAISKKACATNQQINAVVCRVDSPEYLYYQICYRNGDLKLLAGQTAVPIIGKKQFEDVLIPVPPLPEQKKIAEALSDVDELLAAMTTLIEKKRAIKQGAMQELLGMRNEECGMRNVPRRRLPGFSGEWVEKRFDECFEFIGNNTYARECMCDDCDGLANIHYDDVLIRYGSVLDCSRTAIPSLINSIVCRTDRLSDGDVIIADTAEDETVGKAIEIRGLNGRRAVSGLHTIACRPRFDFAPGWLGYYINSSAFHDQLLPLITGTKVSSISRAGLRTTILNVPPLAEQQAIAAVLSDMDAEIAALEAKRAKYESIKQGMMQELLTGKTRLKQ